MILRPPRSTRTDTLFPYTTLFRSRVTWHRRHRREEEAIRERSGADAATLGRPTFAGPRLQRQPLVDESVLRALESAAGSGPRLTAARVAIDMARVPLCPAQRLLESGRIRRSEARRLGKEWVSTCRFRWSPYH